jgi:DmsE family decaheme c-type cytochrome
MKNITKMSITKTSTAQQICPPYSSNMVLVQVFAIIMLYLFTTFPLHAQEPAASPIKKSRTITKKVCLACHKEIYQEMPSDKHWYTSSQSETARNNPCSDCHGDATEHIIQNIGGKTQGFFTLSQTETANPREQNEICLKCHTGPQHLNWAGSAHENEEMRCTDCHQIHKADMVQDKSTQADVCYRCHQSVRGEMLKPYAHPVQDGKLSCSDRHQQHGTASSAQLERFTLNQTCTECHAEKRGPFLWEHAPVSEDCSLCHKAHGSIHPGMLTKRRPHLCQSCHQPNAEFAARHARRPLGYWAPSTGGADHVNRLVLGESCNHCHVQVHGTNHPSGARLMR